MGNGASIASSNMEAFVVREFDRVRADSERTYLVLPEMIQLRSIEQLPIDFADLGTLFYLDANRDGMVTLSELNAFMLLCSRKSREYQAHEFQRRMAAFATTELWRLGIRPEPAPFVGWMAALVRHCTDSDLDLSASLDASIDFASMAPRGGPRPAEQEAAAEPTADHEASEADEASEDVAESPPPPRPFSIPPLKLGIGGGGDGGVVPALNLSSAALKGAQPAATGQWMEAAVPNLASDGALPTIPSPTIGGGGCGGSLLQEELVGMDTVKLLFDLLHVADVAQIDFQSFVDLLQQVAEESGTLDLEDEKFDNVVPMQVIVQFASDFMGTLDTWMAGFTGADRDGDDGDDSDGSENFHEVGDSQS